jgi:glycine/D-amino acid oxidase-like deaminating enzyme/nitrite reductase/ring-hydroxylating ferredoxin subunit
MQKQGSVSLWAATAPPTAYPPLNDDLQTDIAVLGGGIAGTTCALFLRERGARVALIEAERVGLGATGYSTVKVAAAQGTHGSSIAERAGEDRAIQYLRMSQQAVESIATTVTENRIDCGFERHEHLVFAQEEHDVDRLRREFDLLRDAGVDALWVGAPELPFPVAGAFVAREQALFHPVRYVQGLVRAFDRAGGVVVEGTRALDVADGDPCVITTAGPTILARDVVVATHYPITARGANFARLVPRMEHAVAMVAKDGSDALAMCYQAGEPTRSIRRARDEDEDLLVIVGEPHQVGEGDEIERWDALEGWGRERLGLDDVRYRWSTQDAMTFDGLPMAGRPDPATDHIWVATGFNAWGMSGATMAASSIADSISGEPGPLEDLLDPGRGDIVRGFGRFLSANAKVAAHWIGDRISTATEDVHDLAPGEAAVVRDDDGAVALHRSEDGTLHAVSAVCTHLGCIVAWNGAERSWDCPCHGSRFAPDGSVIEPPAVKRLEPR